MTRRQWMWLWIWLLLFFIVFCVWLKLARYHKEPALRHAPVAAKTPAHVQQTPATHAITKPFETFEIRKTPDGITLSGHFRSREEVAHILSLFKEANVSVTRGAISISEDLQQTPWQSALAQIARPFGRDFREGTIRYKEGVFSVTGTTSSQSARERVDAALRTFEREGLRTREQIALKRSEKAAAPKVDQAKLQRERETRMLKELHRLLHRKRITFVTAKAALTPQGKKVLDEVALILQHYPEIRIEIAGYTDSDGAARANLRLSQKRAERVKAYLLDAGVTPDRLVAKGYGETHPIVPNDTPKHKQMNRRVEFHIIGEE